MNAQPAAPESPPERHGSLAALLDQIEAAVAGNCCAGAGADLQRLREELTRHIDGESWLGGALGARSSVLLRLYETGSVIRRGLFDLRDALHLGDMLRVACCVADLREMIAAHLALERGAARALQASMGVTADMPA